MRLILSYIFIFLCCDTWAITGANLVPTELLPGGVCQIRLTDYKFKKRRSYTPRLNFNPCTASFLNEKFLITARHCYEEDDVFYGSKKPQKLISKTIDILCLKSQELKRNRIIKKIHFYPNSFRKTGSRGTSYKEIILIELDEAFSDKIQPLKISSDIETSNTPSRISVLGYGRSDKWEGGIINTGERFLKFEDPLDQARYNQAVFGVYKGAYIENFEITGLNEIKNNNTIWNIENSTLMHMEDGQRSDRSDFPVRWIVTYFQKQFDSEQDNAPLKGGDSGGPVLNEKGEMLAINSFAPYHDDPDQRIAGFSTLITKDIEKWILNLIR
ncbi:MAG: trypsin-like serine protease [Bacteriovoracaceae bacterium]|nr:trypsin-like serine protease [Bacteriovoracaceae bacterium]